MPNKPITIYIIEDDQFIRIFMHDMFMLFGHENHPTLHFASDSTQAKKLLESTETKPDLIFLDLGLPKQEGGAVDPNAGFSLLEMAKNNAHIKDVPVIMFSGYSDSEIKERALTQGAKEFLVKGEYMPKDIMAIVKKYVQ